MEVKDFIEKSSIEETLSGLVALGRYIFEPEIFKFLKGTKSGKGGEIQLMNVISKIKNAGNRAYAYDFKRLRYNIGNKFGLHHPELKDKFARYLNDLMSNI